MAYDALNDIPIEYRPRFSQLVARDPAAVDDLRKRLQQYLETVRLIAPMVKAFNLGKMERLATVGLDLLDTRTSHPEHHRLVSGAILYLIEEEDDEEVTGVLGLDDDVQVFNAVAQAVGRADLIMPFRR